MPRVKLDYVVSFSSEDSENQANNLLAHEVSKKKWLCGAGEPSCSVVLQLPRAVQITTVQVGACHAALVEVLVGRSEKPNDQFEVLVPSSVFLSPLESRKESGTERVRSFTGEQLSAARERRWDRVRVVCSQPYNKHCKYGLSFIHIFEPDGRGQPQPLQPSTSAPAAVPRRLMVVDNFSSDEDDFKPGELFAKHQQRMSDGGSDTGAQIRQATSQALKNIPDPSTKLVKTPITKTNTNRPSQSNNIDTNRQRETLMYTDDDELPHSKIDAVVKRYKDGKAHEAKKEQPRKQELKVKKHEANSSLFKDFINGTDEKKKDSGSKESSKDNRRKDLDSSRSKNNIDDRRNDLNNCRNKDSSKDDRKDLNSSRTNDDRRRKDEARTPSVKKTDDSSQNRESKKRPQSGEKPKGKDILKPGPVSSTPHTLMAGVVFALSGYENPRRAKLRDAAIAMGARFERDWSPACTHLICAFPNTPKLRSVRASQSPCLAVTREWVESCCEHRRMLPWQWFATEPRHRAAAPATWPEQGPEGDSTECDTDDEIEKVLRKQKRQRVDSSPSPNRDTSPKPHSSRDRSPKPHSSRDRSPKPHSSRDRSPKPHSSRDRSPKPHSSRDRSPKPHSSRDRSPKPHSSRDRSPKPHSSRDRSPKPHSSRDRSPKPHSSRDRSPKPHSSRDRSPKPHCSRDKSPKPHCSRDRSPKPHCSKEKSPKMNMSREEISKMKNTSQNTSNMSTDSDVIFTRDERFQGNITIYSDSDETEEEKPVPKEKVDKKSVLPDFFEGYTFVIDEAVEKSGFDVQLLSRYVTAYGGVVVDASQVDSDSEISYVLSADCSSSKLSGGVRVRADWVWRCHQQRELCDADEFAL